MAKNKITDYKLKGVCRYCKKEVNKNDVRRIYGNCSHVYMLSYCSAKCYTDDIIK